MKTYAVRFLPGLDLKAELIKFTKENNIQSGFILTCVGSLSHVRLRMADEKVIKTWDKNFEIVSLVGTLCQDDVHIHIGLSDEVGNTMGGHVKEGCIIYVTAEVIIGEDENYKFTRALDKNTGFNELVIEEVNK